MFLGTKVVAMYGKFDSFVDAHCYLNEMLEQNAIRWGSVISVYVKHGRCEEA